MCRPARRRCAPSSWAIGPVEVRDLRVLAGQTATLDVTLESSPLQLQDLEVVVADNPLVPRDEVTTKQRMPG